MPNKKISQLTDGNLAQAADEFLIARSGDNFRVAGTDIAAAATAVGTLTSLAVSGDVTIADKVIHSGDVDTMVRFPSSDTVTVETAGSERLRVGSNGRVGIGTTLPSETLQVVGNAEIGDGSDIRIMRVRSGGAPVVSWFKAGSRECFAAISGGDLKFANTAGMANYLDATIDAAAMVSLRSNGHFVVLQDAGKLGYEAGSCGAVTQATSRTTGVTLDKPSGRITLVSAAGTTAWQTFTVTNNKVSADDVVHINQRSGTDRYQVFVTKTTSGSFDVTFATTGGTTTEQPTFQFAIFKSYFS